MPRPSKKAEVRRSAARVFRRNGYHATSMDTIASEIGLNKGTLYHYYRSKSELLFDVIIEPLRDLGAEISAVPADDPPAVQLRNLLQVQLRNMITWEDELSVYFQERRILDRLLEPTEVVAVRREELRFTERLSGMLSQAQKNGQFRKFDVHAAQSAIVGMVAHAGHWFNPRGRLTIEQIAEEFAQLVLRGLESSDCPETAGEM